MKQCKKCGAQYEDNVTFCSVCGESLEPNYYGGDFNQNGGYYAPEQQYVNEFDHTAEFDTKDISDNKVVSMLCYLFGTIGIIIAFLGANNSPYAAFHVRQALKFKVAEILMWLIALLTFWTFITIPAAGIMSIVFFVIKIICFVQICKGQAKEPAIIRSLKFLK